MLRFPDGSMDSFYLYLDSKSNLDVFPQNKNCSFTNYVNPEVYLDYDDDYYVGLKNIFFKKKFVAINKRDLNYYIILSIQNDLNFDSPDVKERMAEAKKFHYTGGRLYDSETSKKYTKKLEYVRVIYSPQMDIVGSSLDEVIKILDQNFLRILKDNKIVKDKQKRILNLDENNVIKFEKLILRNGFPNLETPFTFHWIFSDEMADLLGVVRKVDGIPKQIKPSNWFTRFDILYVYSDLVEASRYADNHIDLIDIIPINESYYSKSNTDILYKKIKTKNIKDISIKIKDVTGNDIQFSDHITVILHIKKM